MPIKNLSDVRRLPRLGKIRLGGKDVSEKSGKEYPKALDYFSSPDVVQAVYGPEPRELDIMFPIEDEDKVFPQWLKRYGKAKGLVCKGDGEVAHKAREDGEMDEIECNPDECEWYAKKHCRRIASLQFMLPTVAGFGVWQIDTTSFHSIVNLNSSFDMLRALCGRISGIPLKLRLEPKEVTVNGSKKIVHVMSLASTMSMAELQAGTSRLALAAPKVEVDPPSDEIPTDLISKSVQDEMEGKVTATTTEPEPDDTPLAYLKPEGPTAMEHAQFLRALAVIYPDSNGGMDAAEAWLKAAFGVNINRVPRSKIATIQTRIDKLKEGGLL